MVLAKFDEWPSPRATKRLFFLSLLILAIVYPFMGYFFWISGRNTDVLSSQLSFSASFMKELYYDIQLNGDLVAYRTAETFDYGFMVSYCLLIFSLALLIARKLEPGTTMRQVGYVVALFGPLAAGLDAVENGFILTMLENPLGFDDWLALAHSSFALVKWILLYIAIAWAVVAGVMIWRKGATKQPTQPPTAES